MTGSNNAGRLNRADLIRRRSWTQQSMVAPRTPAPAPSAPAHSTTHSKVQRLYSCITWPMEHGRQQHADCATTDVRQKGQQQGVDRRELRQQEAVSWPSVRECTNNRGQTGAGERWARKNVQGSGSKLGMRHSWGQAIAANCGITANDQAHKLKWCTRSPEQERVY